MNAKKYFLVPYEDARTKGWKLVIEDKPLLYDKPKDKAIRSSALLIKENGGGYLAILKKDGSVQEERSYPLWRDPRRSRNL